VVPRTDEVRKRLARAAPTERLPPETYTEAFYTRVYETLFKEAGAVLRAGHAVVLDATFTDAQMRWRAEALAKACGVPFRPVWLDAPEDLMEARIEARSADASDATLEVLRGQLARFDATALTWPRLDATEDLATIARTWNSR